MDKKGGLKRGSQNLDLIYFRCCVPLNRLSLPRNHPMWLNLMNSTIKELTELPAHQHTNLTAKYCGCLKVADAVKCGTTN